MAQPCNTCNSKCMISPFPWTRSGKSFSANSNARSLLSQNHESSRAALPRADPTPAMTQSANEALHMMMVLWPLMEVPIPAEASACSAPSAMPQHFPAQDLNGRHAGDASCTVRLCVDQPRDKPLRAGRHDLIMISCRLNSRLGSKQIAAIEFRVQTLF